MQGQIEKKLRPPYWTTSHFLLTPVVLEELDCLVSLEKLEILKVLEEY